MSREVNKNMDNLINVSINIKKLRNTLNLTQSEFSTLLGVKQSYISRIENGEKIPNVKLIMKIANVFEVRQNGIGVHIMKGEDVLTIVEDLQRESMNCMSAEFMACLDVVHKYVERESERDREITKLKTKSFIADRSFDRYKESVAI